MRLRSNDALARVKINESVEKATLLPERLDIYLYFDNIRTMEMYEAVNMLAALAQETRLAIYRHLVTIGNEGKPVGIIGEHFGLSGATLSFHLKTLKQAGLLRCRREGRLLIYSADYTAMNRLLAYLTENCCGGGECDIN